MVRRLLAPVAVALVAAALPAATAAQQPAVVVSEGRAADGSVTLVHEALIEASPEQVWEAIATPEGWMRWAVPLARWVPGARDLLETSYDPAAAPGDATTIHHQFLERVPGRRLAFRTTKTPDGFPFGQDYLAVTSMFELEPEGAGTRLRLTSSGYPDNEAGRALVAFFRQGNGQTLELLQALFAA